MNNTKAAIPILRQLFARLDVDQEHFILLVSNNKLNVTGYKVVSSGGMAGTVVDRRNVLSALAVYEHDAARGDEDHVALVVRQDHRGRAEEQGRAEDDVVQALGARVQVMPLALVATKPVPAPLRPPATPAPAPAAQRQPPGGRRLHQPP